MRPTILHTAIPAFIASLTACGAVNQRPYLEPLPGAALDTAHAVQMELIPEIGALVTAEGLDIRLSAPREGYLETGWYDTETARPVGRRTSDPHRVVRLRFFTTPIGEELTEIRSEAVIRRTLDPSLPERENEMLAPPGHPGDELLRRILTAIEERFGEGHS